MHNIEPYFHWLDLYNSENDKKNPFFETVHSEFEFTNAIYNYVIHPQWDNFGSPTLYLKILFVDYHSSYCIIEFLGEWNDLLYNDVMILKREVIEILISEGITKFILIGENVLNFHRSDDCYYQEWFEEVEDGWIALVNFREHVLNEIYDMGGDYYLNYGGELDNLKWRKSLPYQMFEKVESIIQKRLN